MTYFKKRKPQIYNYDLNGIEMPIVFLNKGLVYISTFFNHLKIENY